MTHLPTAGVPPRGPAAALSTLLIAHEQGAAAGNPLLTDAGLAHLRRLILATGSAELPLAVGLPLPHWDGARRQFWFGARLLKEFHQPAPAQVAVLAAFQTAGWAVGHIPNPIPPETGDTADEILHRLHETVKNLNRGLPAGTIRFRTAGSTGLWWKYALPAGSKSDG